MGYEEYRKSQRTAPDKMLLFRIEIIVVALSVTVLGWLKKEEEERKPISTHVELTTLEGFASMIFLF